MRNRTIYRFKQLFCCLFLGAILLLSSKGIAQTKSFAISQKRVVAAASAEGLPGRGVFRFDYAYSGEDIDAFVSISHNGEVIAKLDGLTAISAATLVELNVAKGENLELFVQFGIASATVNMDNLLPGYPTGDWRFSAGFNFFRIGPEGNVVEFLGTMSFAYKLTPPWNAIALTAEPDSIGQGEASTITLQAIEAPDKPVKVPDVTAIKMGLGIIGRIVGGFSLPEFGLQFIPGFTAPYRIASNTTILYEARPDSAVPVDIVFAKVPVVAYSPYDTGINGITSVTVAGEEKIDFTLSIPNPKKAWPTIPDYGAPEDFLPNPVIDNTVENIKVTLQKNDKPLSGQQVQIKASWVYPSGGHIHSGTGDKVPADFKMGVLTNTITGESEVLKLTTNTSTNGKINLRYKTPQFGGKVVLTARTTLNNKQYTSRDTLIVRVPGLVPLPDNGVTYVKVGGTNEHYGPPDYNKDNNHYATNAFKNALIEIAKEWRNLVLNQPEMDDRQSPLNINDISLPKGGKFDIEGNWILKLRGYGHDYHRLGRDADLRTTRSFSVRRGILLEETVINGVNTGYRNIYFEEICLDNGTDTKPRIHGSGLSEHYHIYFY